MASVTNSFSADTTAVAAEVNQNFQDLVDEFDTSTGHDHDGSNSKLVDAANLSNSMYLKHSNSGSETNFSNTGAAVDTVSFAANELSYNDSILIEAYGERLSGTGNVSTFSVRVDGTGIVSTILGVGGDGESNQAIIVGKYTFGDGTNVTGYSRGHSCQIATNNEQDYDSQVLAVDPTSSFDVTLWAQTANGDEDFDWHWKVYVLKG